jgi:hypothetical protein
MEDQVSSREHELTATTLVPRSTRYPPRVHSSIARHTPFVRVTTYNPHHDWLQGELTSIFDVGRSREVRWLLLARSEGRSLRYEAARWVGGHDRGWWESRLMGRFGWGRGRPDGVGSAGGMAVGRGLGARGDARRWAGRGSRGGGPEKRPGPVTREGIDPSRKATFAKRRRWRRRSRKAYPPRLPGLLRRRCTAGKAPRGRPRGKGPLTKE